jgi:D-alanyl-D-alanine carboxypeptidase (penicillin-binding protein 5/6)
MFESLISLLLASTLSLSSLTGGLTHEAVFDETSLLSVSKLPAHNMELVAPSPMSAASILAIDVNTESILYEKNSYAVRPIASLTKLMTAYIVLKENDPSEIVTVSAAAASAEGSRMGLQSGEKISIKNLLYGLFIESGNDAASALAENNAGSQSAFIEKMNAEAKNLGLENTHYANTTGLDNDDAYSTAHDLLVLSVHLIQDPSVREIVNNATAEVYGENGEVHKLTNTNILLGELGIEGLKTGTTLQAGECLVALAKNPEGHEILTVVLASQHRFTDTKILVDWIYRAFTW